MSFPDDETKLYFEKPEREKNYVTKFQTPIHLLGKGAKFSMRKKVDEDLDFVDGFTREEQEKETEEVRKKIEKRKTRKTDNWIGKRDHQIQQDWMLEAKPRRGPTKRYLGRAEHKNEHNPYCLLVKDESGFTVYPLEDEWFEFRPLVDHDKIDAQNDKKRLAKKRKKIDEMWESAPIGKTLKGRGDEVKRELTKQAKLRLEDEVSQQEGEVDFDEVVGDDVGTFDKENDMDVSHEITFDRPEGFDNFDYMEEEVVTEMNETNDEKDAKLEVSSLLKKRNRKKGEIDDDDDTEPARKKRKLDNFNTSGNNSPDEDEEEEEVNEEEMKFLKLRTKVCAYLVSRNQRVPIKDLLGYLNITVKKNMNDADKLKYTIFIKVLKEFTKREKIDGKTFISLKDS